MNNATLQYFFSKYKYVSDEEKYNTKLDIWEIPKLIKKKGFYEGDCESAMRYLKANVPEFKDWEYWYCKLNGNGHCILYKNGDVIDCNIKGVVTLEQYTMLYKPTDLRKYNWFTVFSKGFLLWKSLLKN